MRLDRFLSVCGLFSRREADAAVRTGRIAVNGEPVRSAALHIDPDRDAVTLDGLPIVYRRFLYILLNKPAGYISATEDGRFPCVTELLPPDMQKRGLFPCGRLDRDTVGLMLLTDDGALAHRLLSPKHHVEKVYAFSCTPALPPSAEAEILAGMPLGDEICKPAALLCTPDRCGGQITLTEGKYHQIKRMIAALGSRVTALERIAFAGIRLDADLPRGAFRPCSDQEIERLRAADIEKGEIPWTSCKHSPRS